MNRKNEITINLDIVNEIMRLYRDYIQACTKSNSAAASYQARAGNISDYSIMIGQTTREDVLDKISSSDTLWEYGYHNYLSKRTKKAVYQHRINKIQKLIDELGI